MYPEIQLVYPVTTEFSKVYLFSWDEIPGNDSERLIDFLKQNYSIDWVKTAKIEKIDDGKTIRVSVEKNFLSLSLNNEKTKVNLKIDDGRTNEFIVKTMNGKLNIYSKEYTKGCLKIYHIKFKNFSKIMIEIGNFRKAGLKQIESMLA